MRNILLLILTLFASAQLTAGVREYANKSVLSEGKWVKVKVSQTGVHQLTYSDLKAMGFDDPSKVRVFGYGGEMLSENLYSDYIDDLPEVPLYQGSDFFLFYAKGSIKWKYSASGKPRFTFEENPYSDDGYYFITSAKSAGKRIAAEQVYTDANTEVSTYTDYKMIKKDEINVAHGGRNLYGDMITANNSRSYSFSFPNFTEGTTADVVATVVSTAETKSSFSLTSGGISDSKNLSAISGYTKGVGSVLSVNIDASSRINASLKYSSSLASAKGYVDHIIANMTCDIKMVGSSLSFRNTECVGYTNMTKFTVKNSGQNTIVWNVTNALDVRQMQTTLSGDELSFVAPTETLQEFVAINPSGSFPKPDFVSDVKNQNLHGFDGSDLVIVTNKAFESQAYQIASLHEDFDNMTTLVVTPDVIYNEFSSGTPDATAIRAFMKMLFDRSLESDGSFIKPKYLLLFGDGSYDNKGVLATKNSPARNFVLTYQETNSLDETKAICMDDYYSHLEDCSTYVSNSAVSNIGVGRLPVSNATEADNMVAKIENFMKDTNKGDWKNKVCFVIDDNEGSPSSYHIFLNAAEQLSKTIYDTDNSYEIKKLYYDAYTRVVGSNGARYPEISRLMAEQIDNGVALLNYIGHSNTTGWSAERTMSQNEMSGLFNKIQGVWVSSSCEFSRFDAPTESGGETLILNPYGGGIGVVSSTRTAYANENNTLNNHFVNAFLVKENRIGDFLKEAKNAMGYDSNKRCFSLLGDPALSLMRPDYSVSVSSIKTRGNISDEYKESDTLKALSRVLISGSVNDSQKNIASDFSGSMNVVIYDKKQVLSTKGNLDLSSDKYVTTYTDYPNKLFSGVVEIIDGKFSFDFIVPKDINYQYGAGRMVFYAIDNVNGYEAKGFSEDFVIGGSNDNANWENEGPNVNVFVNSDFFKDGSKVNESPLFFAEISDENGINSSGCGIGHDITLTTQDGNTIVLNSDFVYDMGSCTSGSVSYKFKDLAEGKYTLTFKVWDLLNNSTTKTLNFTVVKGLPISIGEISASPNPAKESVKFTIKYDRPDELTFYKVRIYDLNGRMLKELEGKDKVENASMTLDWDLTDSNGRRVDAGVYVYRMMMKTESSDFSGKSEKIMVLPQ